MTMVHQLRSQATCLGRVARTVIVVVLAWSTNAVLLRAADPPVHFNHSDGLPPGAIGSAQLLRGGPLPGYFQPVSVQAPQGVTIETAETGDFADPRPAPLVAGMLIGRVYRLRVTNIPQHEGLEVYPTIEVIDRLYPPAGLEFKFPIPVELTQEELELALDGRFVTRVVYLEEPEAATPVPQTPEDQSYFEVAEGENPLDVADALGRPMAILRLGGRLPDAEGPDANFLFGCPPLVRWTPKAATEYRALPERSNDSASGPVGREIVTGAAPRRVSIVRGPSAP